MGVVTEQVADMLSFLRQFFKNAKSTGSIVPSSPALARSMVVGMGEGPPQRWLEVGPGTGPFTKALLGLKRPGDTLVIVELSGDFCRQLERDVLGPWRASNAAQASEVELIHAAIEDAGLEAGFDHIVCGLPFNNFPPELVESILSKLRSLLRGGGTLRYFAYVGARTIRDGRGALAGGAPLSEVESRVFHGCTSTAEVVMVNLPPARATTVRVPH